MVGDLIDGWGLPGSAQVALGARAGQWRKMADNGGGMTGPGRPRTFRGGPRANELARFLGEVGDRHGLKTASFASLAPQGPGKSVWAEYLNGSKIIPAKLLGEVLQRVAGDDRRLLQRYLTEGKRLRDAAEAESRNPSTAREATAGDIERVYQRLDEAQARMFKAQEIAEESRRIVNHLIPMGVLLQSRIDQLEQERVQQRELDRGETELRLSQTRHRLERMESELAKAQHDRYTAEQARAALTREALLAREEIERLRRKAADLDLDAGDPPASVVLAAPPEPTMEDIDDQLDLIASNRFQREEELADLVEASGIEPDDPAMGPTVVAGSVVPSARRPDEEELSGTTSENSLTSASEPVPAPAPPSELVSHEPEVYGPRHFMRDLTELVRASYGPEEVRTLGERLALPGNSWDLGSEGRFPTPDFLSEVLLACGADGSWEERWHEARRNGTRRFRAPGPTAASDVKQPSAEPVLQRLWTGFIGRTKGPRGSHRS